MRRALLLARRGEGRVHPNPLVGAVLALKGRVLAEGAHECFGGPHAEANALKNFKNVPAEATFYVTLEPCCHSGKKTPPCLPMLLSKKVRRIVVAMKDPNPRVGGRGLSALRKAGVRVRTGVLENDARSMNRDYSHWTRTGRPYVTLKFAQSLDGRLRSRASKWISGPVSRRHAHRIRAAADAVLVGVNTVLTDDPRLSVRLPGYRGRQPLKVVLDAELRTPARAAIFSKRSPGRTLIFCSERSELHRRALLARKADIVVVPEKKKGYLGWGAMLWHLGRRGITHLMIEGGGTVAEDALKSRIVQEMHLFVAPVHVGPSAPRKGLDRTHTARLFKIWRKEKSGRDIHYMGAA